MGWFGYPRCLKGEWIPFAVRIFAIIDVGDALVSDRPYRKGLYPAELKNMITQQSGINFEPRVVDAFLMVDLAL